MEEIEEKFEFETPEETVDFIKSLGFTFIGNNKTDPETDPEPTYSWRSESITMEEEEIVSRGRCGGDSSKCCGGRCGQ